MLSASLTISFLPCIQFFIHSSWLLMASHQLTMLLMPQIEVSFQVMSITWLPLSSIPLAMLLSHWIHLTTQHYQLIMLPLPWFKIPIQYSWLPMSPMPLTRQLFKYYSVKLLHSIFPLLQLSPLLLRTKNQFPKHLNDLLQPLLSLALYFVLLTNVYYLLHFFCSTICIAISPSQSINLRQVIRHKLKQNVTCSSHFIKFDKVLHCKQSEYINLSSHILRTKLFQSCIPTKTNIIQSIYNVLHTKLFCSCIPTSLWYFATKNQPTNKMFG